MNLPTGDQWLFLLPEIRKTIHIGFFIHTAVKKVSEELAALRKMEEEQLVCFDDDIRYMTQAVDTLTAGLKKAKEVLDF